MKTVWKMIDRLTVKRNVKNTVYLGSMILINILIGGVFWLLLGRFVLPKMADLLCFMGYPGIFAGFFGGILYLYHHEFSS